MNLTSVALFLVSVNSLIANTIFSFTTQVNILRQSPPRDGSIPAHNIQLLFLVVLLLLLSTPKTLPHTWTSTHCPSYWSDLISEHQFSSHVTLVSHTNKLVDTCKLRRHSTTPAGHHHNQLHEHCRQGHARHLVYSLAAELSELPTDGLKLTGFFFREIFPIWSWNWVRDRRSNTEPIPTQCGVFYRGSSYLEPIVSNYGTEQPHTKWNLPWDISLKVWKLLPDEEHDSSL